MSVDLHLHSIYSDGYFKPAEVVRKAARAKLKAVALTDHDTCRGVPEALRAGNSYGIRVIPAVELSTVYRGKVLHILGLGIDMANARLNKKLKELKRARMSRAIRLLKRVSAAAKKKGIDPVDTKEFVRWVGDKEMIMRGDIAKFLVHKGFGRTAHQVFRAWLEDTNVPVRGLSVRDAIALIHGAGGAAILAHPKSSKLSLRALTPSLREQGRIMKVFADCGLDGCEAISIKGAPQIKRYYLKLMRKLGMIATGGSDFHGPHIPGADTLGYPRIPERVLKELDKRIKGKNS